MIPRTAAPLLLSLALFGCASDGVSKEKKEQLVTGFTETAQQYYLMGELDRANGQCIRGLALEPDDKDLRLIQAWTLQKRGHTSDIVQAERVFRELQSTGDFRALLGLAEALERKGLVFAEAAANLESGRKITAAVDPEKRLVDLQRESKECWTESLEQYTRALVLQKANTDVINGLMRVETLLGMSVEALAHAELLVAAIREDLEYWKARSSAPALSSEDESRVREQMRAKIRLLTVTHLHAAELLVSLKRDGEALPHLDAAAELDPDRADVHSRRAQIAQGLRRYAEAIRDIKRFITLSKLEYNHPDIQRAWRLERECQQALGRASSP